MQNCERCGKPYPNINKGYAYDWNLCGHCSEKYDNLYRRANSNLKKKTKKITCSSCKGEKVIKGYNCCSCDGKGYIILPGSAGSGDIEIELKRLGWDSDYMPFIYMD